MLLRVSSFAMYCVAVETPISLQISLLPSTEERHSGGEVGRALQECSPACQLRRPMYVIQQQFAPNIEHIFLKFNRYHMEFKFRGILQVCFLINSVFIFLLFTALIWISEYVLFKNRYYYYY